jgi:hypothetical protein
METFKQVYRNPPLSGKIVKFGNLLRIVGSRAMSRFLFLYGTSGHFSFCRQLARNAERLLTPDPKSYIHLLRIMATIMKYLALIYLLFMLSACSGEGTMYLYSGGDAYGQGLSYPGYGSPLSLTSFVAGNNTSVVSPAFQRATIYRPELEPESSRNRSGYYHSILPLWSQFTFYLPFTSMQDWFSGSYDLYVPAVKDFLREDWKPSAPDYDIPAIRQFMQVDGYREGVEAHNDPDRMGLNHFMDDDEPPGRPLL